MTELNLSELTRLERRVRERDVNNFDPYSGFCLVSPDVLRPLLDLVHRMGRVLEAGCGARVPPVTDTPTCFFCGLLCLIPHKAVMIEVGPGRYVYFHNAHEEDCWAKEKETRAALDAYREAKESTSQ